MGVDVMSPQMKGILSAGPRKSKYSWGDLMPGTSFTVPDEGIKLTSLMTLAYRTGKRLGRKFKVLHHPDLHIYEVGRVDGM